MKSRGFTADFTDWERGQLVATSEVLQDAKKAFQQNDWYGAFARVHCLIEFWMQEIYEFDSKKNQISERVEFLNKHFFYGYWRIVEEVRRLGYITDDEAKRLVEYGRLRSRIFHRLIKYSHSTAQHNVVQQEEMARGFEEGLALESLVRDRLRKIGQDHADPSQGRLTDSS